MAKDLLVKGEARTGISRIWAPLLDGSGEVPFVDEDEASGGSVAGIVAITTGTFSVTAAAASYTIKHGLGMVPDLVAVLPIPWNGDVAGQIGITAMTQHASAAIGLRALATDTTEATSHYIGSLITEADPSTEEITIGATQLCKFVPDQTYRWVAIKFEEAS